VNWATVQRQMRSPTTRVRLFLLTLLLANCGEPSRALHVTPMSSAGAAPSLSWLARGGERFSYHVSLAGVNVAAFTLVVAGGVVSTGAPQQGSLLVQSSIQSRGSVTLLKPVHDEFASWLAVDSGRPRLFQASEQEPEGRVTTTVDLSVVQAKWCPLK
jgi:hypothetical protein